MARATEFIDLCAPDVGLTAVNQPSKSKVPVPGRAMFLLLAGLASPTDIPPLGPSREFLTEVAT